MRFNYDFDNFHIENLFYFLFLATEINYADVFNKDMKVGVLFLNLFKSKELWKTKSFLKLLCKAVKIGQIYT